VDNELIRLFDDGAEIVPAQRIAPRGGKLTRLLDKTAVSLLSKPLATRQRHDPVEI
jgi:hypothetical protein